MRVRDLLAEKFPSRGRINGVILLENKTGLTDNDKQIAKQIEDYFSARKDELSLTSVTSGLSVPSLASPDKQALMIFLDYKKASDDNVSKEATTKIYDYIQSIQTSPDLKVYFTGWPAMNKDIMNAMNRTQNLAGIITVIIVLLASAFIYRAPLAMLIPPLAIGFPLLISMGLTAEVAEKTGLPVSDMTPIFMIVVLMGAGTNYCLFLISRFKEELNNGQPKSKAVRETVVHSGKAIASSASTVIIGMGGMIIASLSIFRTSGPAVAIGVAITLLAGLTLVPAILAVLGKVVFWPQKVGGDGRLAIEKTSRLWTGISRLVVGRPVVVLVIGLGLLLPLTFFVTQLKYSFELLDMLPSGTRAVEGFNAMGAHFPSGQISPTTVVIKANSALPLSAETYQSIASVSESLGHLNDVATVRSLTQPDGQPLAFDTFIRLPQQQQMPILAQYTSKDLSTTKIDLILNVDPNTQAASNTTPAIRDEAKRAVATTNLSSATVLVGGEAAINYDVLEGIGSDFRLIVLVVLGGIFIVLAILLRSLVSPIYLLLTILLSYGTALGLAVLVFQYFLGYPGLGWMLPVFAFVFIVALGEDFNIFLMSRINEETAKNHHRVGIQRSVALTGGVITSCGIIMAGAFSSQMLSSLRFLYEMGFVIVFGILIDTFLVRTMLVPAIATLLGKWNWWPGRRNDYPAGQ